MFIALLNFMEEEGRNAVMAITRQERKTIHKKFVKELKEQVGNVVSVIYWPARRFSCDTRRGVVSFFNGQLRIGGKTVRGLVAFININRSGGHCDGRTGKG